MRIVALIFMTLTFIIGGAISVALYKLIDNRLGTDDPQAKEQLYSHLKTAEVAIEQLKKEGIDVTKIDDAEIQQSLEIIESTPPIWKVEFAGKLGMLSALLAVAMVFTAFTKKRSVKFLSIAVIASAVLVWFSTPDIAPGLMSGINPKTASLVAMIALTISAVCAFASYNLHLKKVNQTA